MSRFKRPIPDDLMDPTCYGDNTADAIHHALVPLDKMVSDFETVWGPSRLIELASPEMAAKFGSAKARLDAAVMAVDAQEVTKRVGVLMRGYTALVKHAQANGHKPMAPQTFSITSPQGNKYVFAKNNNDAHLAAKISENARVYSIEEIACILDSFEATKFTNAAKEHFPGATVTAVNTKPPPDWKEGDEMPW